MTPTETVKLKGIAADYCECAVEEGIRLLHADQEYKRQTMCLDLWVSIYDAQHAMTLMIDNKTFRAINKVVVTPDLPRYEFIIKDEINNMWFVSEQA